MDATLRAAACGSAGARGGLPPSPSPCKLDSSSSLASTPAAPSADPSPCKLDSSPSPAAIPAASSSARSLAARCASTCSMAASTTCVLPAGERRRGGFHVGETPTPATLTASHRGTTDKHCGRHVIEWHKCHNLEPSPRTLVRGSGGTHPG